MYTIKYLLLETFKRLNINVSILQFLMTPSIYQPTHLIFDWGQDPWKTPSRRQKYVMIGL